LWQCDIGGKEFKRLRSDNSTLKEYMQELLLRYDRSLCKKKEHFRADSAARLEGVFYTFPWEAEYAKEIAGEAATNINLVRNRVKLSFSDKKDSNGDEG
jgi:hypothetical protein